MKKTLTEVSYLKEQLLESKKYAARRDLLGVLLENRKSYTEAQVTRKINEFMKGKVK